MQLTKGVAACVGMMKVVDGRDYRNFWRRVRAKVRGTVKDEVPVNVGGEQVLLGIPIAVEALFQSYKVDDAEI